MPTPTTSLLTRLTFSAGLGLTVIAGGSVAAGAAPPDPDNAIEEHPPFEYDFDVDVVLADPPADESDPPYDLSDYLDMSDYYGDGFHFFPDVGGVEPSDPSPGAGLPHPGIPIPEDALDVVPEAEPGPEVDTGPIVEIDPCVPVAVCTTPEIPEDFPGGEIPEETPDETPDETPEETPDTDPVVPTHESSLPFTGTESLVLAVAGVTIAGAGAVALRAGRRMSR